MTSHPFDRDADKLVPLPEDPEAKAAADEAWLYNFHRENGSLGDFYQMFPRKRPWNWGLSAEEKDAIRGRQKVQPRGRERGGNER